MVSPVDGLISRAQLSAKLADAGLNVSVATLAALATRGFGPAYQRHGAATFYSYPAALAWAKARSASPRRLAFDADHAARAKKAK